MGPSYFISSDKVRSGFCAQCGTSVCYEKLGSEKNDVHVGTLSDKTNIMLVGHNGFEARLNYFKWEDYLPKFESVPYDVRKKKPAWLEAG